MPVRATAVAEGAGGTGAAIQPLLWAVAAGVILVTLGSLLAQLRDTPVAHLP